ncbi:MAG: hypothetical protein ACW981_05975 [Candidatus Hodarchaeales archaeon]|jgi:hypothetical protein
MNEIESLRNIDVPNICINRPRKVFSLFIPLGENNIVQLVDNFRARNDLQILETDLYYIVKIKFNDFVITFYSRGLVTFERESEVEKLAELVRNVEESAKQVTLIISSLLTEYQITLLSIFGGLEAIPVHKTIVIEKFDKIECETDFQKQQVDLLSLSENERDELLKIIANNEIVLNFIGDPRSVDHRPHEDIIIGTHGSIIRSEDINDLLSFHAYNRSLHLFLTKYNLEIEKQWSYLNECDEMINKFEDQLAQEDKGLFKGESLVISTGQRSNLAQTKSKIITALKNIDYYIVLTQFIEDSIEFTSIKILDLFESKEIRENSFHIRKVLKTLQDRVKDLKIVSQSFMTRGQTLVTRIDLYDKTIAFEIQQRSEKVREIVKSWKRTYTFGLPKSKIEVKSSDVVVLDPSIVFSLYLPLGENSIIQLVDKFRNDEDVKIVDSDLYYFVKVLYLEFEFTFYSRGLINIASKLRDGNIKTLIDDSLSLIKEIPFLLKELLTEYHLSLVEVLGDIANIPIHKTIVIGSFSREVTMKSEKEKDQFLNGLANDPYLLSFIGLPRSVDSRVDSDVLIGTEGSLIRSEQLFFLLSYHCYNRSLHLFIRNYNIEVENVWNTLNSCEDLINEFEEYMSSGEKSKKHKKMFSGDRRKDLAKTRLFVIHGIKNISNFMVLTKFIEESINFTIDKYSELLEEGKLSENSFHIRKVLRTLKDRVNHLKVVSESFTSRSESLMSRLEMYDSEIAYETQQKIERTAFIMGFLGTILALIAIFIEL